MTKIDVYWTDEQQEAIARIIGPCLWEGSEVETEVSIQDKQVG